ncbi:hypothetical protein CON53_27050 [Bacillus cereus]|nr:hypothetical protein CON53_27050 [Bacillus cereus]PFH80353.1 hypothetical protein COI81_30005 [Bacillus cereus]PFR99919.1 hypothetical protein COK55_32300 [Bacillus cereus]PGS27188.1 hypothetical protein COC55_11430 [Bacillus cereus]
MIDKLKHTLDIQLCKKTKAFMKKGVETLCKSTVLTTSKAPVLLCPFEKNIYIKPNVPSNI